MRNTRIHTHPQTVRPQAHEKITIPFKLQSFEPPEGYLGPRDGVVQAPSDGSASGNARTTRSALPAPNEKASGSGLPRGHALTVEFVSVRRTPLDMF